MTVNTWKLSNIIYYHHLHVDKFADSQPTRCEKFQLFSRVVSKMSDCSSVFLNKVVTEQFSNDYLSNCTNSIASSLGDWQQNHGPLFQPMRSQSKTITPYVHDFSRTLSKLQVIAWNSDWFIKLFAHIVNSRSKYFGIGFTWKPLNLGNYNRDSGSSCHAEIL